MFMTRVSLLGRDPSGTRSVLAWTVCEACDYRHGAHDAGYIPARIHRTAGGGFNTAGGDLTLVPTPRETLN